GDLVRAYQGSAGLVDCLVQRFEEMVGVEEVRDAMERFVVHEDRSKQRLLRLDVVRGDSSLLPQPHRSGAFGSSRMHWNVSSPISWKKRRLNFTRGSPASQYGQPVLGGGAGG